jgi:hypothetical protein
LDAGYCPFCGVFVDGDFEEHWCPESSDEELEEWDTVFTDFEEEEEE